MLATKRPTFILLFLLISFGSVSAVLFTPALPQISTYFGVTSSAAQLTVTLFLVGYALGQLIYGPLANGYGRKIALYIGISLEIISALICALSASFHAFWLLIVGRLFMALGASVGLKMSFTLVADCYSATDGTKIISHLMMAFAIAPGLGITLGGFLAQHLGWQSCFYFLAGYGALLLYLVYRMPETATLIDFNALKLSNIFYKYTHEFNNTPLILGGCLMGCATAFVYIFAALAPFVAMEQMHLNPSEYGLWNLLPPIGILVGSQFSAYLSKKMSVMRAIILGIVITLFGIALMFIAFALQMLFAIWLFLPLTIIYVGMSFIFANASALAMQNAQDKSTASAIMNFINMGIATVCVLSIGLIPTHSVLLLPVMYGILIILIFVVLLKLTAIVRLFKDAKNAS